MVTPISRPLKTRLKRYFRQRSLRSMLMGPFVLQILLAVGIVGIVGHSKGKQAVTFLTQKYGLEVGARIYREVHAILDIPYAINAATADAFELGLLDWQNPDQLEAYFWRQLRRHDAVSYIFAGNPQGAFAASVKPQRHPDS